MKHQNSPKISVIIPLHNAEQYIGTCIDSILQQTFKNFELIVIDDCSSDRSVDIVKKYNDNRIKIVSLKRNVRQGFARNIGLEMAMGEWIAFVDNDDWVESEYLETLYTIGEKENADIIRCGYIEEDGGNKRKIQVEFKINQGIVSLLTVCKNSLPIAPWGGLYNRKFLMENYLRFSVSSISEDFLFHTAAVYYSNCFITIPNILYHYRIYSNSTSHKVVDIPEVVLDDYFLFFYQFKIFVKKVNKDFKLDLKTKILLENYFYDNLMHEFKHLNEFLVGEAKKEFMTNFISNIMNSNSTFNEYILNKYLIR